MDCRNNMLEQASGKFVAERHEGPDLSNHLVIIQSCLLLKGYTDCPIWHFKWKTRTKKEKFAKFKPTGSLDLLQKLCLMDDIEHYVIVCFVSDNVLCCYYKLSGHNAKKEHITARHFSKDLYASIQAYQTKKNQVTEVKKIKPNSYSCFSTINGQEDYFTRKSHKKDVHRNLHFFIRLSNSYTQIKAEVTV